MLLNPSPQKLLFLRCLPYMANATQGRRVNTIHLILQNNAAEGH